MPPSHDSFAAVDFQLVLCLVFKIHPASLNSIHLLMLSTHLYCLFSCSFGFCCALKYGFHYCIKPYNMTKIFCVVLSFFIIFFFFSFKLFNTSLFIFCSICVICFCIFTFQGPKFLFSVFSFNVHVSTPWRRW